jgi:fibronectin type 3 domain-containing protein
VYGTTVNAGNNLSTRVDGLDCGITYYFSVRAVDIYNVIGNLVDPGVQGTVPCSPVTAPSGFSATAPNSTLVTLQWTDNSTNETGFRVERSSPSNQSYSVSGTTAANVKTFNDSSVLANTTYYYRLTAFNGSANSNSIETSVTTPAQSTRPNAPASLGAALQACTNIRLTWPDVANESGYRIRRSESANGTYGSLVDTQANITSYIDSNGTTYDKTYYYRIWAFNDVGESTTYAQANASTCPAGPINLVVVSKGYDHVDLSWTNRSTTTNSFRVERKLASGTIFTSLSSVNNQTTYQDLAVLPNNAYNYRVFAVNQAGDSPSSNVLNVTTDNAPDPLPQAPSSLSITQTSVDSVKVNWTDNSQDESGFGIERKKGYLGIYERIAEVEANSTDFEDKTLPTGDKYSYRVYSFNDVGNSGYSEEISITLDPALDGALYEVGGSGCGHIYGNNNSIQSVILQYVILLMLIIIFISIRLKNRIKLEKGS